VKMVFALRSPAHFSYIQSTIARLCDNEHQVEAVFDPRWGYFDSDQVVCDFAATHDNFTHGTAIRPGDGDRWHNRLSIAREYLSISSYLSREDQSDFYLKRWENNLPDRYKRPIRIGIIRKLLASGAGRAALRAFERMTPPYPKITRWLEETKPDVLVASPTNMRFSGEVDYIKAAKVLGIPTVVIVLSWDNLTTKGLIHVEPDVLLAWNQTHFNEAVSIHGIDPQRIVITGAPFFDKWLDAGRLTMTREEFCQRVGLNRETPFALYMGSSQNISQDETWLIQQLAHSLHRHQNPAVRDIHLVVRAHPANAHHMAKLDDLDGVTVWPKAGSRPGSEAFEKDFYNSLLHCVATVGVNTTGMIDAVINDKACITIVTEEYRATQSNTVHFNHLVNASVLDVTAGPEECADALERIWKGEDRTQQARHRFTQDFVRPRGIDRPSAVFASRTIEMAADRRRGKEIDAEL